MKTFLPEHSDLRGRMSQTERGAPDQPPAAEAVRWKRCQSGPKGIVDQVGGSREQELPGRAKSMWNVPSAMEGSALDLVF